MSLRDVAYKSAYISGVDNLVEEFYIPSLKESVLYQRRTGYFNARALAMAARGLSVFLRRPDARMQLLCSVQLERDEAEVLGDPEAYVSRHAVEVLRLLDEPYDAVERQRLGLLARLLQDQRLEIRIAVPTTGGIYHEKAGIFTDSEGNQVAFNGSGNETPGGWRNNTESFHAFTSWQDDRHIRPELRTFQMLWENRHPTTKVVPLPEAVAHRLVQYVDYAPNEGESPDEGDPPKGKPPFIWTPELAYAFEARRLWNHHRFAHAEAGIHPYEHQDYIASTVLEAWPPRFLLCDEVGLGKTIEAGLIIKGLLGSGRVDRLLILVPRTILPQWQEELWDKFAIESWILDGRHVLGPRRGGAIARERQDVDAENPFRSKPILLVSSQLLRSEERAHQAGRLEYDLIIVDEAHHARARGRTGRRVNNQLLNALEELRLKTQGLLLLTATPVQLDRRELWDLLNLLELPGQWQDEDAFDAFYNTLNKPTPDWQLTFRMLADARDDIDSETTLLADVGQDCPRVNVHALRELVDRQEIHRVSGLNEDEVDALRLLSYRLAPLYRRVFRNTRELLKRYRAEGKFSGELPEREPQTRSVTMEGTPTAPGEVAPAGSEWGLYDRIEHFVRHNHARYEKIRRGLGFLMTTYQKRLTSSFYALRRTLERRKETLGRVIATGDFSLLRPPEEELSDEDPDVMDLYARDILKDASSFAPELLQSLQEERTAIESFLSDLKELKRDSKAEALEQLLVEEFEHGTRQVLVFSQFADTVTFLLERLLPRYGDRLGSFTGQGAKYWRKKRWNECSKQEIQIRFADADDSLSILVCTDAASEGLNLQTCHVLVNYDLPWNPMRIEQRIGRVDRIHQQAPVVRIYTLLYTQTVEGRVYERCLKRIGYFRSALGHLQPILETTMAVLKEASVAPDDEAQQRVLDSLDERYQEQEPNVAELDQLLRNERLLRSYVPRLRAPSEPVPLTQHELQDALLPVLAQQGWTRHDDGTWVDGTRRITFDATLQDRSGTGAVYVTPQYPLATLFPTRTEEIPVSFDVSGRTIHRLQVEGVAGYAVRNDSGFFLVERYADLQEPVGQRFETLEEVRRFLEYQLGKVREQLRYDQRRVWSRRRASWEARTRLYLDKIAYWRSRQSGEGGDVPPVGQSQFRESWGAYLRDTERILTRRLVEEVQYEPSPELIQRPRRGRPPKESPREARREGALLEELETIRRNESLLAEKVPSVN